MDRPSWSGKRGQTLTAGAFERLWYDGAKTLDQIARELGISRRAVMGRAKARQLPLRKECATPAGRRKVDRPMCEELYAANVRVSEIAEYFETTTSSLRVQLRRWGMKRPLARKSLVSLVDYFGIIKPAEELRKALVEVAEKEVAAQKRRDRG